MVVKFLVESWGMRKLGVLAVSVVGVAAAIHATLFFMEPSLPVYWGGVCAYMLAFGLILPTGQALAMEPAGEFPGFASSVLGAVLMLVGALGATLAGVLFNGSHTAISGTMAIFGVLVVGCFLAGRAYDRANA